MPPRSPKRLVKASPSQALMLVLMLCVAAGLLALFIRLEPDPGRAQAATPTATAAPTPDTGPVSGSAALQGSIQGSEAASQKVPPEPTPTLQAEPDYTRPVPESEPVDKDEWFSDAVFIGDSRTDGLRLYSGITPEADFLYSTGITVFEVMNGKQVIRQADRKVSILEALGQKQYGKVYISLGVNELGGNDPEGYARVYGALIDNLRELQPAARLYIQSIIPVNTAKCIANGQRSYVTNENIYAYNSALAQLVMDRKVPFLDLSQALADEYGEVPADLSSDGVHFKKEGYKLWLDYLACHTET